MDHRSEVREFLISRRARVEPEQVGLPRGTDRRVPGLRSDHFRRLWGRHDVWQHDTGTKRFHHHVVGDLELHFNGLDLVGQSAVQLTIQTAEPGSRNHEALQLLGAWASPTPDATHAEQRQSTI